ncbi:hypothetical protein VKT23_009042 [Stygiomarasmius scandens]|uniref:Uncharacterized protein n=1 Tax=Marasmiellus scandens TaxID=2682957 RepID=A0ABR1JH61_9AGAR
MSHRERLKHHDIETSSLARKVKELERWQSWAHPYIEFVRNQRDTLLRYEIPHKFANQYDEWFDQLLQNLPWESDTPQHLRVFSSLVVNIYVSYHEHPDIDPPFNIKILPAYRFLEENKSFLVNRLGKTKFVCFLAENQNFSRAVVDEIKSHLDNLTPNSPFWESAWDNIDLEEGETKEARQDRCMELGVAMRVLSLLNGNDRHQVAHSFPTEDEMEVFLRDHLSIFSDSVWELALSTVMKFPWNLKMDVKKLNLMRQQGI